MTEDTRVFLDKRTSLNLRSSLDSEKPRHEKQQMLRIGKLGRYRVKRAEATARGWFVYVKELTLYSQKDWQMSKSLQHKIVSD